MRPPVSVSIAALLLAACGGEKTTGPDGTTVPPPKPVASVQVTPSTHTLAALGATQQFQAVAKDVDGATVSGKTFTWASSETNVATIDASSGIATAVTNGSTSITATTDAVSGTASLTVAQTSNALMMRTQPAGASAGQPLTTQPAVEVHDANGNVAENDNSTVVTAAIASGGGTLLGTTMATATNGVVTFADLAISGTVGDRTLTFTAQGLMAVTSGSFALAPGPATQMALDAGNNQTADAGTAVATAPSVKVSDALGNGVQGVSVTFEVASGGGTVVPTTPVATNSSGIAAVTSWTLGTALGTNTLTATSSGLTGSPVTFSATGVAGAAAAMAVSAGDNQSATFNTAVSTPPAVIVTDANANPVSGVGVTFTVASGGGTVDPVTAVTTDANGIAAVNSWTLGGTAGANTLDASATGLATVTFNATAVDPAAANSIGINNGDGQTIVAGATAIIPPSALVLDFGGSPVVGVTVDFAVTTGASTISGGASTSAVTDASGIATANTWVFDATAGTNVITATVTGVGSVMFTGTGVAAGGYDIEVRILTTPTMAQQTAFDNAEARWENLVVSELSDGLVTTAADVCGITHPALNETVDDLLILVRLEAIDGVAGVLASAGPCLVRTGTVPTTVVGVMRFDTADLPNLEAAGELEDVILHEMGHVIGIGTLWDAAGFLQNPSLDADGNPIAGQDTHFNGNHAVVAFEDRLGGSSYTGGASVPVENSQGGQGTRDAHWRESVFVAELMTGFINSGVPNPLSLLTIASLADLGIAVNPDGADTYSQVFTVLGASYGKISLGDDIWRGPLYTVSPTGTIRRVR